MKHITVELEQKIRQQIEQLHSRTPETIAHDGAKGAGRIRREIEILEWVLAQAGIDKPAPESCSIEERNARFELNQSRALIQQAFGSGDIPSDMPLPDAIRFLFDLIDFGAGAKKRIALGGAVSGCNG